MGMMSNSCALNMNRVNLSKETCEEYIGVKINHFHILDKNCYT